VGKTTVIYVLMGYTKISKIGKRFTTLFKKKHATPFLRHGVV